MKNARALIISYWLLVNDTKVNSGVNWSVYFQEMEETG